jgi:hypothetical protein
MGDWCRQVVDEMIRGMSQPIHGKNDSYATNGHLDKK